MARHRKPRQRGNSQRILAPETHGRVTGTRRRSARTVRHSTGLLRSVIAAVAATGFGDVTVAGIVRGARVSKAAFYAHFADKEDCFLAATREGGRLMTDRVAAAGRHQPAQLSAEAALRASLAAFLSFLAAEPAFARAFYIDMPGAGARAVQ